MIGNPTMVAALVDRTATDIERRDRSLVRPRRNRRPDRPTWNGLGLLLRRRRSVTRPAEGALVYLLRRRTDGSVPSGD